MSINIPASIKNIAGKKVLDFKKFEIGGNKSAGRNNDNNNRNKPINNKFLITLGASIP